MPISDWCGLWSDVIKTDDPNHRRIGVDVKLVTSASQGKLVATYLAKYVAKEDNRKTGDVGQNPGRWWGKWNIEEEIPIEVELDAGEAEIVVKTVYSGLSFQKWKPFDGACCSVFGESMGTGDFQKSTIRTVSSVTDFSRGKKKKRANVRKKNGL